MKTAIVALLAALGAGPAFSQTVMTQPLRYDLAPWWMDQPVIASTGMVQAEFLANRANFTAAFRAVGRDAAAANTAAANKVRALGTQLATYGADKVRVETTFTMQPIYEQYRNADGNLVANQRADRIDSYEVTANLAVEIRDVALAERVYATVMRAQPTNTQRVFFRLEAENETKTALYGQAVADAARRARLSVESAGARLGSVKLIDPTGRACQTDVLVTGATRSFGSVLPQNVTGVMSPPPPPPLPIGSPTQMVSREEMLRTGQTTLQDVGSNGGMSPDLPLQPPMQTLSQTVCVIYALQ